MQAIQKKICSQRGASITFALLLFLVCAVLSSVIIVAATTASGRMSNLAKTDQRYYAVTSAAELMIDLIENQPVTILQKETITQDTVKTVKIKETLEENPSGVEGDPPIPVKTVEEETEETLTPTMENSDYLVNKQSADVTAEDCKTDNLIPTGEQPIESIPNDAAVRCMFERATLSDSTKRELSLSAGADRDALAVSITETVDQNGTIKLLVKNKNGDPYTLELTFVAETKPKYFPNQITLGEPEINQTLEGNTTTIVTTTTKETVKINADTYTWKLESVKVK